MKAKKSSADNVRVFCRVRPLNASEESRNQPLCVTFPHGTSSSDGTTHHISCTGGETGINNETEKHQFQFTNVFPPTLTQDHIYKSVAAPIVSDVMQGYNGTIFVYGQTGSGKTHTMFGDYAGKSTRRSPLEAGKENWAAAGSSVSRVPLGALTEGQANVIAVDGKKKASSVDGDDTDDESEWSRIDTGVDLTTAGVIPRAIDDVFQRIAEGEESGSVEYEVRLFFVEVYMEQIRDLLGPLASGSMRKKKVGPAVLKYLQLREDVGSNSFFIEGCSTPRVSSAADVLRHVRAGLKRRATSATAMNETSSRSHCILNLSVKGYDKIKCQTTIGKLYLVDLAGSEKVGKTNASGMRLEEAKLINKSLSALGNLILSLTDRNATHVPYRDSVLTKLLKDSLGGNAHTALVICCSPAMYNAPETLSTLRFGARASAIQNKAVVNREMTAEQLKKLLDAAKEEIDCLQAQLRQLRGGGHASANSSGRHSQWKNEEDEDGDGVSGDRGGADRVSALLLEKANERARTQNLESQLADSRDQLQDAQDTVNLLRDERDRHSDRLAQLQAEILAWEGCYHDVAAKLADSVSHGQQCHALLAAQGKELDDLRGLLEGYGVAVGEIRVAAEAQQEQLQGGAVTPLRCSPTPTPASPHADMMSPATAAAQSWLRRRRADGSPTPIPSGGIEEGKEREPTPFTAAHQQQQMIYGLQSQLAAAQRKQDSLQQQLRQSHADVQSHQHMLNVRRNRIDILNDALKEEAAVQRNLRDQLEKERESIRGPLEMARNDANYWRRRFEELSVQMRPFQASQRASGLGAFSTWTAVTSRPSSCASASKRESDGGVGTHLIASRRRARPDEDEEGDYTSPLGEEVELESARCSGTSSWKQMQHAQRLQQRFSGKGQASERPSSTAEDQPLLMTVSSTHEEEEEQHADPQPFSSFGPGSSSTMEDSHAGPLSMRENAGFSPFHSVTSTPSSALKARTEAIIGEEVA